MQSNGFYSRLMSDAGSGSIKIFPQDFQIGEASIQYFRYADAATPANGRYVDCRSGCFQRLWSDTYKGHFLFGVEADRK
jgi:hypothetical protein